jgi:hypothetical protein
MQFITSILTLGLAASTVLAATGAGLGERQAGSITVEYYSDGNCNFNEFLGTYTYTDDGSTEFCVDPLVEEVQGIRKIRVTHNTLTRESVYKLIVSCTNYTNHLYSSVRFFSRQDCKFRAEGGQPAGTFFPVSPGQTPQCASQTVLSVGIGFSN